MSLSIKSKAFLLSFCGFCLILFGCMNNQDAKGYVYQFNLTPQQPSGTTTVSLQQRPNIKSDILGKGYKLDESGFYRVEYNLKELIAEKSYIFKISGSSFEATISFPAVTSSEPILLGGLDSLLYSTITSNITATYKINVNQPDTGKIVGAPNVFSYNDTFCGSPIGEVVLTDKETGTEIGGAVSKFYFSKSGTIFTDVPGAAQYDGFIFVNVPQGSYNLKFYTQGSSAETYTQEVVVVASNISFGFAEPCQRTAQFKSRFK